MMVYKCMGCGEFGYGDGKERPCPASPQLFHAWSHAWQELDQGVAIVMLFRTTQKLTEDVERLQYELSTLEGKHEEQLCALRRDVAALRQEPVDEVK